MDYQPNTDTSHEHIYPLSHQPLTGPERMQTEIDTLRITVNRLSDERMEVNRRLAHLELVIHRILNQEGEL